MTVLVVVETVILAVLCVLVAGLLRAYGTVLRRLHQLDGGEQPGPVSPTGFAMLPSPHRPPKPVASAAEFGPGHDIAGESLAGELVHTRVVGVDHDTLLLFLSSGCSSCEAFWDELAGPVPLPAGTRLLVVPQGAEQESVTALAAMAPPHVDVVLSAQAWLDYEVPGSPHVVYVDGATGRIRGEGTGQSLHQVCELLARSTGDTGFVAGDRSRKPARDARQETVVDRELLAAGIVPGDPRLYGADLAGADLAGDPADDQP